MINKISNEISANHLLAGLTIVVTRPRAQAKTTAHALEAAGAKTILYPVLDIAPLPDAETIAELEKTFSLDELKLANAIIFVSANAVEHGMPKLKHWRGLQASSMHSSPRKATHNTTHSATLYAIGKMTADALRNALRAAPYQAYANTPTPIKIETPSSGNDSEALLSMPALQDVAGQHIIIVCGDSKSGGRTVLQQTLRERGARVTLLICYKRKAALATAAERQNLEAQLQSQNPTAFLALSVETLDSLMSNIGNIYSNGSSDSNESNVSRESDDNNENNSNADNSKTGWQRCTLLVSHKRVAEAARARGWQHVEVVPMVSDALIAALHLLKPRLLSHN